MSALNVVLIILAVILVVLVVLYFLGRRLQKKQTAQREQLEATKQTVSMLIIDKKRLPVKDSGLPQVVIEQTPKLMRRSKLPVVKAKVGPKIMTLVADENIYDMIPVKKEVKADISGIYITGVKGIRGPLEAPKKKEGFLKRMQKKASDALAAEEKENNKKNKKNKK